MADADGIEIQRLWQRTWKCSARERVHREWVQPANDQLLPGDLLLHGSDFDIFLRGIRRGDEYFLVTFDLAGLS